MANAQQLRAARIARHIASSGDYDADCVSLMFQQADTEVKEILAETSEMNAVEKIFRDEVQPNRPAQLSLPEEQNCDASQSQARESQ